jgi:hypothetical protein
MLCKHHMFYILYILHNLKILITIFDHRHKLPRDQCYMNDEIIFRVKCLIVWAHTKCTLSLLTSRALEEAAEECAGKDEESKHDLCDSFVLRG